MGKNFRAINGNFKGKDILSLDQFSPKDISLLFRHATAMKKIADKQASSKILAGTVTTLLFYEPSSRTFSSFNAAIKRLGGATVDIQNPHAVSSVAKGETLEDTILTFQSYSEAIVMRNPNAGAAAQAAEVADIPILNAGDGKGEHPTQALLDLYTIYNSHKRLDNLTVVMGGDMLNGRTVHSLIRGLALYPKNTVYLLSPKQLRLAREDFQNFSNRGIRLIEIESEKDIPGNADIWYWTRVQKERFENVDEYEKLKDRFKVTQKMFDTYAHKKTILMHPLPRVGEIATEVDRDPRAVYLTKQMKNGMYIRMALLGLVLGRI